MNNTEFTGKVRTTLADAGILVGDDESIFSSAKVITVNEDGSVILSGPENCAWTYVSAQMPEAESDRLVTGFVSAMAGYAKRGIAGFPRFNTGISLSAHLAGLAKLLGGTAPTDGFGTKPLKELLEACVASGN